MVYTVHVLVAYARIHDTPAKNHQKERTNERTQRTDERKINACMFSTSHFICASFYDIAHGVVCFDRWWFTSALLLFSCIFCFLFCCCVDALQFFGKNCYASTYNPHFSTFSLIAFVFFGPRIHHRQQHHHHHHHRLHLFLWCRLKCKTISISTASHATYEYSGVYVCSCVCILNTRIGWKIIKTYS